MAEQTAPGPAADLEESRMPFVEHLRELRVRIRNSVIAIFFSFFAAFAFKEELFVLLMRPLLKVWRKHQLENPAIGEPEIYFGSLIEPFWTYFSIALWASVFIASPLIFHQLWKFIAPGLYKHERRYGIAFAITSAVFFLGGAAFCYFLVLPQVYDFLLGYATSNVSDMQRSLDIEYTLADPLAVKPLLTMQEYLGFARKLLIGFGLVFELPLVIFFLSLVGAVNHRSLWRFNRWWIVCSFLLAAALTPPDIVSQLMMAGPLIVLYNLSIIVSWIITVRRERRQKALDEEP
jgi:sec-independent protein translocase protein TatC